MHKICFLVSRWRPFVSSYHFNVFKVVSFKSNRTDCWVYNICYSSTTVTFLNGELKSSYENILLRGKCPENPKALTRIQTLKLLNKNGCDASQYTMEKTYLRNKLLLRLFNSNVLGERDGRDEGGMAEGGLVGEEEQGWGWHTWFSILCPPTLPCYSLGFMYSLVLTTWICFSVSCRHIGLYWYAVFQPTHCYQLCCFHCLSGLCWQEKFIGWVQQKQSYCIKHIFYSYANTP